MTAKAAGAGVIAALFTLVVLLIGVFTGFDKSDGGEIGVVRNGGWFDDNRIRQVLAPASDLTWTGFWSSVHRYPSQQRFYTMTADAERGGRAGIDLARTPSKDGVDMGIEATIYFTLNIEPAVVTAFDEKFGTRQYRTADGDLLYAWDGVAGWNAFFDAAVRPVIDNVLRVQMDTVSCAELVSSCSLLRNSSGPATPAAPGNRITAVEQAINENLPRELRRNLGGDFFLGIKFNLVRVTLPGPVQEAVTRAQAAFAAVSEATARVAQAEAEAEANAKRQQGYDACPACAQIDMIKALPPGVTTYAPGAGAALTLR
jgi:hypothetical protein